MNLEWTFVLFTHFGVTSGITRNPWVIPVVTPKWVNLHKCSLQIHSKFTLISLFSKIHSLKSEHIHSFLFREYFVSECLKIRLIEHERASKTLTLEIRGSAGPQLGGICASSWRAHNVHIIYQWYLHIIFSAQPHENPAQQKLWC